MKRLLFLVCALVAAGPGAAAERARQGHAQYDALIATIARANLVPEALVHRVIVRESKYNPDLIGRGGTIGLMQVKLATARGVGYTGDAAGLRNPETNLTYGVKYLAGAYRAAGGDHDRAMRYFASGYYHAAKQQRLERLKQAKSGSPSAPPQEIAKSAGPEPQATESTGESANEGATDTKPATAAAKPKKPARQRTEAGTQVPAAPAAAPDSANGSKPR
ncbi:MAG: lytic transglycosylase domain-containing protein [Bradyrhizobium sp.]|nr:lytic transglycosylase domain-containing protein [Bradyrhizobium sp.]